MNQTVWKVVVPNYEDKVPISMRRSAKYYKKDDPELDNNLPNLTGPSLPIPSKKIGL